MGKINRDQKGFALAETLAIALVVLVIGTVAWYIGKHQTEKAKTTPKTTVQSADPNDKTQVSDKELAAASSAKDCIKLLDDAYEKNSNDDTDPTPENNPGYYVTSTLAKAKLKSINLSNNTIITSNGQGTTNYSRWSNTLPTVYDSQCNKIKLSNIKAGDTLNLYLMQDPNSTAQSDVLFIIQKI